MPGVQAARLAVRDTVATLHWQVTEQSSASQQVQLKERQGRGRTHGLCRMRHASHAAARCGRVSTKDAKLYAQQYKAVRAGCAARSTRAPPQCVAAV